MTEFGAKPIVEDWNNLIQLENPTVAEVQRTVGITDLQQTFRHSTSTVLVSDNIVMRLQYGHTLSEDQLARSIGLVVRDDALEKTKLAIPQPQSLVGLSILGIPIICSAEEMRTQLQARELAFGLQTTFDRWVISFPGNFSLVFVPTDEEGRRTNTCSNPGQSALAYCDFLYGSAVDRVTVPHLAEK